MSAFSRQKDLSKIFNVSFHGKLTLYKYFMATVVEVSEFYDDRYISNRLYDPKIVGCNLISGGRQLGSVEPGNARDGDTLFKTASEILTQEDLEGILRWIHVVRKNHNLGIQQHVQCSNHDGHRILNFVNIGLS